MIDFKPIEDFTFDDCVRSIERHRAEGTSPDDELLARYNSLLESLKAEEKRDYPSVKTIDRLERYIRKYSNLTTATKYKPVFLTKAKQELADIKRSAKTKKRIKAFSYIALVIGILVGIFFIGYKRVSYFYVSNSSVTISKGAAMDSIILHTNAPYVDIDEYISWLEVSQNGSSIIIKADRNTDDKRSDSFSIHAYPTFFGERISFMEKSLNVYVEQQDGHATYLNVGSENLSLYPEGGSKNIYITTDGYEWDFDDPSSSWLSVSKENSHIEISASENPETYNRTASFRVYSDNIEKYIYVSQDFFSKDAGITNISWPACGGNEDIPIKVDYYIQGYKDDDLYVVMKIYSDNNNYVWYKSYDDIYESQSRLESYRTFKISPYSRRGRNGNNTVYVCISRYSDGSSPICSFNQRLTLR